MASRESQGLQIALILFVMVSVVLAVMTFLVFSSASAAKKEAADANSSRQVAADSLAKENFRVQYLKHLLGAAPLSKTELENSVLPSIDLENDAEMKAIDDAYKQDMATFGEGLPEEKMNYKELPGYLIMALRDKNVANTGLSAEVARLNTEKTNLEQSEQKRTATAQQELQKAKGELADERQKFQDGWGRMNQEKAQVLTSFQQSRDQLQKEVSTAKQQVAAMNADMQKVNSVIQTQKERITVLIDEPFEAPDGRVTWVNQGARAIWINLGLADGLRRQTTFSVYDQEAMNVGPSRNTEEEGGAVRKADNAKGKVEVTRVLDQHLAEARIVEDSPGNPILPGDQIFSPAWKPGRRVRFALVGVMDVDGDRRSDAGLLRNIITMGGGVIDAEVHDDGSVAGELSANTRYLVRGNVPNDRTALNAYSDMIGQAEQLGVQEITLAMLLDLMGYKAEVRTIPLGRAAGTGAPRATTQDAGGDAEGDDVFRERTPPGGNGSAF
jgi:hypothetical protein